MSDQPVWEFVANLGDESPLEHGGQFIYRDTTGRYDPVMEVVTEMMDRTWRVYRFDIAKLALRDSGVLSDNEFHPELDVWFHEHDPEAIERHGRDRRTEFEELAGTIELEPIEFERMFCSDDLRERGLAYMTIADYHGIENFDSYPLEMTLAELYDRYNEGPMKANVNLRMPTEDDDDEG